MSLPTREELQAWVDDVLVVQSVDRAVEEGVAEWVRENADRLLKEEVVRLYISSIIPSTVIARIISTFEFSGSYSVYSSTDYAGVVILCVSLI